MNEALERQVRQRAGGLCEYCRLPQDYSDLAFEIDHIIAQKHGGPTTAGNLALSCVYCNSFKGPNIAGIDPRTKRITPLFHPRRHKWTRHFRWQGAVLVGRTPTGRATVAVLAMNCPEMVALRESLISEGVFPPEGSDPSV
jgi:5-methylcytosine-specific restriction endonuclease McrA